MSEVARPSQRFGPLVGPGRGWAVADPAAVVAGLPPAGPPPLVPPRPAPWVPWPSRPGRSKPPHTRPEHWSEPALVWLNLALEGLASEPAPPRAARALALLVAAMGDGLAAAEAARAAGVPVDDDALLASVAAPVLAHVHPGLAGAAERRARTAMWVGAWRGRATPEAVEGARRLGAAVVEAVLAAAHARFLGPRPEVAPPEAAADARPEREAYAALQRRLTDEDRAAVARWGVGEAGLVSRWFGLARDLARRDGLTVAEGARMLAALGVALHDGLAATEAVLGERPADWMRGADVDWQPALPHLERRPSGFGAASAAGAAVLAGFFPAEAARLEREARDAAYSRVLGGQDWFFEAATALETGRQLGARLVGDLLGEPVAPAGRVRGSPHTGVAAGRQH